MPSLGTVTFEGKSGTEYKFRAYPLGTVFKKGLAAVFVRTRRGPRRDTGAMKHRPIFLGQLTDLRAPDADSALALGGDEANCVCVHVERDTQARMGIQQDLSAACRGPKPAN